MLKRITINGYKSLRNIDVELGRLTVLFGPNASGKSNFIDGLQLLSRIASSRTLSDAMSEPLRGYPVEQFSFPSGGLASLLSQKTAEFSFQVDIETGQPVNRYLYRVKICIRPESGSLSVGDEYLAWLNKKGEVRGNPSIEKMADQIRIRRKSKPANPQRESVGLNYAVLSDIRFRGIEYRHIEPAVKSFPIGVPITWIRGWPCGRPCLLPTSATSVPWATRWPPSSTSSVRGVTCTTRRSNALSNL